MSSLPSGVDPARVNSLPQETHPQISAQAELLWPSQGAKQFPIKMVVSSGLDCILYARTNMYIYMYIMYI